MSFSDICNGSHRNNASEAKFLEYSPTFRLVLLYLLVASVSFVCLCSIAFFCRLYNRFRRKCRRHADRFDAYLLFLTCIELGPCFLILVFGVIALSSIQDSTARYAIFGFVYIRLLYMVLFTPLLINRFYSAKFPSKAKFALAIVIFPPKSKSTIVFIVWWMFALVLGTCGILLFFTGGGSSYPCLYVITNWERYVVLGVSYSVIGYCAILIIYIVNEKRFTGALQNERDIPDIHECSLEAVSIDVHWFSIEWGTTRVCLRAIIITYVTWLPLLIVLTVFDDKGIDSRESIEICGFVIAIIGFAVERPLLYFTDKRFSSSSVSDENSCATKSERDRQTGSEEVASKKSVCESAKVNSRHTVTTTAANRSSLKRSSSNDSECASSTSHLLQSSDGDEITPR
ncbi:uncharacterized protein [Oscarella lobularis]|uniref:uncharacterized protein isoform X4 n=1 Tax=Oscarella lobularis TaxID=121494 RepID=UPI003313F968